MNQNKPWLYSAKADFFGIFMIPLLSLAVFLFSKQSVNVAFVICFFLVNFFLSGAHNWGPILYFLTSSQERQRITELQPKINLILISSLLVPILLGYLSFYFYLNDQPGAQLKSIAFYGVIYFCWNLYHFSKQQFGLITIYKSKTMKANKTDRFFDLGFVFVFQAIVPACVWYFSNLRVDGVKLFFGLSDAAMGWTSFDQYVISLILILIMFVYILAFIIRSQKIVKPVLLMYICITIQAVGIVFYPLFFTTIIFTSTHWVQEIYLLGKYSEQSLKLKWRHIFLIGFLISSIFYMITSTGIWSGNSYSIYGKITGFTDLTGLQYIFITTTLGIVMGLNLVHFALDKYLHMNRKWL